MKQKIRLIIRENINKLFENDYFPTFDFEDEQDMENKARDTFMRDFRNDKGENDEPFIQPSDEEISTIKAALHRANIDLPSDMAGVAQASEILDQQLSVEKTPEQIRRLKKVMEKLWGAGGMNESKKKKTPKAPKEPKIPKSSSEKKKKEYKIKPPKPPKHEN